MTARGRLLDAAVSFDRAALQAGRGARYGLGVGIPLLVGVAIGRLVEGGVVAVGAVLVGLTDSGTPYRGRGRSMLVAAGAVACSTFVGVVIGAHHVVAVIVLALWSFADGMCIVGGAAAYLLALMAPLAMVAAASGPADGVRCVGQDASRLRRRPRADRAGAHRLAAAPRSAGAIRGRPRIPILAEWVGSEIDDRVPVFSALQQARAVLGDAPQALSRLVDIADLTFIDLIAICTTAWVLLVSSLAGIPEFRAAADRVLDTAMAQP